MPIPMTMDDNGKSLHVSKPTETTEQATPLGDLQEEISISSSAYAVEPFTVGLSPSFWAHVPLLVAHLNNLKLINGINCLVLDYESQPHILPITKVTIVGTIVGSERRSNGSILYVVDDGSGFIDCLHWVENPFSLPSLTGDDSEEHIPFPVGALVKVLGRLECLSIHVDQTERLSILGHTLESQRCVREVHVTVIQELTNKDGEWQHWMRCQSLLRTNQSSTQVLAMLGPDIQKQVADRNNLPSVDDMCGEWRLFGAKCRCSLSYKDKLLCKSVPRSALQAEATHYTPNMCLFFQIVIV